MLPISREQINSYDIEKKVYSLKTLHTPRISKVFAYWLMGILAITLLIMFLPWQQNIEGSGVVTAFNPSDRPQEIQTVIAGRITEWRIREGQYVNQGDTLVVISEVKDEYFDPELLKRLKEQIDAKLDAINATKRKIEALNNQITALKDGLNFSTQKALNKLQQAKFKLLSDSADLEAEKIQLAIAKRQFEAAEQMYKQGGVISLVDYERRKAKLQESTAKVIAMENKVLVARNEVLNARIELNSIQAEYNDKISKAESDRSSAVSYLADAEGEYSKIRNKYASVEMRTNQYYIIAPQDGFIVKAKKTGIGEMVKENTGLLTFQPADPSIAAEIYIRAMDITLVTKGRHVRLEFDGFPALQITGWPRVAVGTFGGTVSVIDQIDSKEGKFRILVTPDKNEKWPKQLRIGSGVYGWIMLDDVPVWYEVWRQLNGFPPSLYEEPPDDEEKKKKSGQKLKIKLKK
ncbi:MAG: HlyD family secretion protein [Microscillaceae bacterium]|nr:HlyD family secretion protein [Microscillaceae bacterium]MDW8461603.1 HlyD family efflux transporter periplasmic adaptor subunit [Cytophagales bacterium]